MLLSKKCMGSYSPTIFSYKRAINNCLMCGRVLTLTNVTDQFSNTHTAGYHLMPNLSEEKMKK